MLRLTLLALALLGPSMAVPALAQSEPEAFEVQQAQEEEVICRRVAVTGSHRRGPRVCRTESQWNANAHMQQERARGWVGNSAIGSGVDDPRPAAGTCCD
ncbi:MAG: hypothetical protein RLN87_13495 [Parasphingopyxis sp.]|uniref:hypothetical protein n=1 Tax=Parasphingopyxis sp. TaxID=1920299 RepID=UPI0032F079E1